MNLFPRSTNLTAPPDPFIWLGIYRLDHFSSGPTLMLPWLATFFISCLKDLFDLVARTGCKVSDPYPGGAYLCIREFMSPPPITTFRCRLELRKVRSYPYWVMSIHDLVQDIDGLWQASLWFLSSIAGVPMMNIDVHRYRMGTTGSTFFAQRGKFSFTNPRATSNVSIE